VGYLLKPKLCVFCFGEFTPSGSAQIHCSVHCMVWSKIEVRGPDECWRWKGWLDKDGYATISRNHKNRRVGRFLLEEDGRPCVGGQYACHSCDTPGCCNVRHLWPGTNSQNQVDSYTKGRKPQGHLHRNSKFTADQVLTMRGMPFLLIEVKHIANLFDCHPQTIRGIVLGRSYRNVA